MTNLVEPVNLSNQELYFQGPVSNHLADALLLAARQIVEQNLHLYSKNDSKQMFSALVELVQNISEYNEINFKNSIPSSLVFLEIGSERARMVCQNLIQEKDKSQIINMFRELFELDQDALQLKYKNALLQGKSLGLLMLRKMPKAEFNWELITKQNKTELQLELILNYGAINH